MTVIKFPDENRALTAEFVLTKAIERLREGKVDKVMVVVIDENGVTHQVYSDNVRAGEIAATALMMQQDAIHMMVCDEEGGHIT